MEGKLEDLEEVFAYFDNVQNPETIYLFPLAGNLMTECP